MTTLSRQLITKLLPFVSGFWIEHTKNHPMNPTNHTNTEPKMWIGHMHYQSLISLAHSHLIFSLNSCHQGGLTSLSGDNSFYYQSLRYIFNISLSLFGATKLFSHLFKLNILLHIHFTFKIWAYFTPTHLVKNLNSILTAWLI